MISDNGCSDESDIGLEPERYRQRPRTRRRQRADPERPAEKYLLYRLNSTLLDQRTHFAYARRAVHKDEPTPLTIVTRIVTPQLILRWHEKR